MHDLKSTIQEELEQSRRRILEFRILKVITLNIEWTRDKMILVKLEAGDEEFNFNIM